MNAFEKAQQLGRDLKTAAGKAAMNLLPYVSLVESAKVAMFGAVKYPPGWTWTKPSEDWREKYGSAVVRHAMKWVDPTVPNVDIDIDPETGVDVGSGLSHMAHACFNAMICLWHEHRENRERQEQTPQPEPQSEPDPVLIKPAVTGRPLDGFIVCRLVFLGLSQWPDSWRIRSLGHGTYMLIDERYRDLLFEIPSAAKVGGSVKIDVFGGSITARVEQIDIHDLKVYVTAAL